MRQLKILLAIIIALLIFLLGYWQGQAWEEHYIEPLEFDVISTGSVNEPTEAEVLTEKVNSLVGNESISITIVKECMSQTEDYKLCIQNLVGVASAESSVFKKGMYPSNNWFGRMQRTKDWYKKKRFNSVEESIKLRIEMYVRNGWDKRTNGAKRGSSNYCASECTYRVRNYNSAISKLGLD